MKPRAPASPSRGRSYQADSRDLKGLQNGISFFFYFLKYLASYLLLVKSREPK